MFALDLFNTPYERALREGAVDKVISEGGPYDLPGIDYDRPGDTPRRPRPSGSSTPRRHPDDPDFMDPDQRRLRADQERVRKANAEYHTKKKPGVAEGGENVNEFAAGGGGGSGNYFQALASAWYNGAFDTGSLQKGIKSKEDVERLLNRGIVAPDGKIRKYAIDYNSDFDGVVISSDDYYEHADYNDQGQEVDSRTGQKWGPNDYMEFGDEELDESAKYRDPKYKGQLYTQEPPDYNNTREYDNARFDPKPKGYPGRKKLPGGGEYDRTDPLVRGAGIGRSGIKNNINLSGKRKGLPSRDQITSLKQSIKDISGQHVRANLPEQGEVTKTATGLKHRATDKYGAGNDEPHHYTGGRSGFSDPGKYARDLEHVNKQLVKDLDASMGISWKNRGTKGVEVDEQGVAEGKKKSKKKKSSRALGRYFFPGYGYYGSGESGNGDSGDSGDGGGGGGESVNRAVAKGNINELSTDKLAQYKTAAALDAGAADKRGDYERGDKRFAGIVKATKKQFANDLKKHGQQGVAESDLEEVDRRGFLKGLGAAAGAAALGSTATNANAQEVNKWVKYATDLALRTMSRLHQDTGYDLRNWLVTNVGNWVSDYCFKTNSYNAKSVIDYCNQQGYEASGLEKQNALITALLANMKNHYQDFLNAYKAGINESFQKFNAAVQAQQQEKNVMGNLGREEFDVLLDALIIYAICKDRQLDNSDIFKAISTSIRRFIDANNAKDYVNNIYPKAKQSIQMLKNNPEIYQKEAAQYFRNAGDTIEKLDRISSNKKPEFESVNQGVAEGSSTASDAVERAILNRIMVAHTDLLMRFGPDKVMQAAEEVAYNVGDVDEIGTSDVSAYVNQVRQILGA